MNQIMESTIDCHLMTVGITLISIINGVIRREEKYQREGEMKMGGEKILRSHNKLIEISVKVLPNLEKNLVFISFHFHHSSFFQIIPHSFKSFLSSLLLWNKIFMQQVIRGRYSLNYFSDCLDFSPHDLFLIIIIIW